LFVPETETGKFYWNGIAIRAELGRENVYLNGAILGMKKRELDGKFEEIVTFAGSNIL